MSGGPRVSKSATQPCLQMAGGDKPRPYGPVRSSVSVGAALVSARPYDSGRVKWARGSGRSHSTTAPAARDLGTSISRWLALPRNRAA